MKMCPSLGIVKLEKKITGYLCYITCLSYIRDTYTVYIYHLLHVLKIQNICLEYKGYRLEKELINLMIP